SGSLSPKELNERYHQAVAARETRRTLQRIEAAGCRVVYRSIDVRNAEGMADALGRVGKDLGPIRGVIHGAGVLADRRIEDKTEEQFNLVYTTKVAGLRNVLAAVDPSELKVLALFSSSSGRLGRVGQSDYALANEVLNKLGQDFARSQPGCRVVSVNWGPWD